MSDRKESVDSTEVGQAKLGDDAERVLSNALKVLLKAALALAVVVYFAAAGIYLGLRYAVLPQINDFRPRIEAMVSSKIHARLSIGRISAHWSGMQPTFDIDNLRMDTSDGQPGLVVPHASATISWSSLLHLAPVLSNLTVDGPDVIIARTADGELFVAGVPIPTRRKGNDAFMTWLLKQQSIVLRDGILRWRDAERGAPELALRRIKLLILNDGLRHRLALQAPADGQLLHGPLDFRADFQHEPFSAMGAAGELEGPRVCIDGTGRPADARALHQDTVRNVRRARRQPHLARLRLRQAGDRRRRADGRRHRLARPCDPASSRHADRGVQLGARPARQRIHAAARQPAR